VTSANISVFALYPSVGALRAGAGALKAFGMGDENVSVLFKEDVIAETFGESEGERFPEAPNTREAYIGGPLDALSYIYPAKSYAISGALRSLGVETSQASFYQQCVKGGSLLICVRASTLKSAHRAAKLLASTGAVEVVRAEAAQQVDLPEFCFPGDAQDAKFAALN
jgi:hypothetical protein